MRLLDRGYTVAKFFPAEINGGVAALKALGAPIPQMRSAPRAVSRPRTRPTIWR